MCLFKGLLGSYHDPCIYLFQIYESEYPSTTYSSQLELTKSARILVKRIDQQKQAVGIVVGVIEPTGRRVVAYGNLAKGRSAYDRW